MHTILSWKYTDCKSSTVAYTLQSMSGAAAYD